MISEPHPVRADRIASLHPARAPVFQLPHAAGPGRNPPRTAGLQAKRRRMSRHGFGTRGFGTWTDIVTPPRHEALRPLAGKVAQARPAPFS